MAALFSKVDRGVWNSVDVRSLSRGTAGARELWLYLLTCPASTSCPGLFVLSLATIADDLEWSRADVFRCLAELSARGMAKYDEITRLVWLPKAACRRSEEVSSAKTVKGWRNAWDGLPNCALRTAAFVAIAAFVTSAGSAEAVRAFGAEPPSGSTGGPIPELGKGFPGHREGLPRTQDVEEERRGEKRKEEESACAHELSPNQTAVMEALVAGRDLYPAPEVSDADVMAAALRITVQIAAEPAAKGESVAALVRDAVAHGREHRAKYERADGKQVLARVEAALTRFVLADVRSGKRPKVALASTKIKHGPPEYEKSIPRTLLPPVVDYGPDPFAATNPPPLKVASRS